MKPGDKVRCITNRGYEGVLGIGTIYTVDKFEPPLLSIEGFASPFYAHRFELVSDAGDDACDDEYAFFAEVRPSYCPCNTLRSACRYHA